MVNDARFRSIMVITAFLDVYTMYRMSRANAKKVTICLNVPFCQLLDENFKIWD